MANKINYGPQKVPKKTKPLKEIDKYWGNMKTLFEGEDYTVKRIFMNAGSQSSLEYHTKKRESYFIEKGRLKVGVRIGRAENRSLILEEGEILHIPIGLMHMRMAIEDTVIIEVSTKDDDEDSHIVEDGMSYKHIEEEI